MKRIKDLQVELETNSDNSASNSDVSCELKAQRLKQIKRKKVQNIKSGTMYMEKEIDSNKYDRHREGNPGWADAMQKILDIKKPKRKKTIVLSKAKKLCDIKRIENEQSLPFEIDKMKDEIKTEEAEQIHKQKPVVQLTQKRKDNLGIRVKPSLKDRDRERTLQKIATKGVVQLFNAVTQQQGEIHKKLSEAGPLERKCEQVLKSIDKSSFLDVLMGGSKSISIDNTIKKEENKKGEEKDKETWNVLREDFVMGTKLKDWDCKDEDENSSAPEDMDSDD